MKFCGNCGSRLVVEDGQDPIIASRTPAAEIGVLVGSDLKERFYQAGLESAGQRRTVTVLFADLCDYTGLSTQVDDEALYDIIQRYIEMLAEKVYQFEGMVDKITGDGLVWCPYCPRKSCREGSPCSIGNAGWSCPAEPAA